MSTIAFLTATAVVIVTVVYVGWFRLKDGMSMYPRRKR
jgi:hypothetical protein